MINKDGFVKMMAAEAGQSQRECKENLELVIDMIQKAVIEDGGVDFYGFMKIEKVHKEATTARSPKDGSVINVPAKNVPKAKFSKRFKAAINE